MGGYYNETLAAERLERCYDIAPARVRQYLDAEVGFVLDRVSPGDVVLELGCGYGRVIRSLAARVLRVVGIDTSRPSLAYARTYLIDTPNCLLLEMDAANLTFPDDTFDAVVCIQNGISAFHTDQRRLLEESIRVARRGGRVIFSSYAEKFWEHRLEWFRLQAKEGLVGTIDEEKTRNGRIVCLDGFTASGVDEQLFLELAGGVDGETTIVEVDESSLFCVMIRR